MSKKRTNYPLLTISRTGTNLHEILGGAPECSRPTVVATAGHLGHTSTFTHDQFHQASLLAEQS